MTKVKAIFLVLLLLFFSAATAYIAILRMNIAELTTQVSSLEEKVRSKEARIAGLELSVSIKEKELTASKNLTDSVTETNEILLRRLWEVNEIIENATSIPAKPGEIIDEKANDAVVGYLNKLVPDSLREASTTTN